MKNSLKLSFYICIITLLSACNFKSIPLEINEYVIDFKLNNKRYDSTLNEVFIEEPTVNRSFNSRNIFYTRTKYQFEKYALNKWMNKPSDMIYTNLLEAVESSKVFRTVQKEKKDNSTYLLKTEVIDIYNSIEDDKSYAVLKVKFYMQFKKDNIRSFIYDKKILTKENNPYGFVVAINKGFSEAISEWLNEIRKIK